MDTALTDRKLRVLLNEVAISNAVFTNLQSYKRLMLPVLVTSIIAAVSLEGNARWVAAFLVVYSFMMLIEIGYRARRAERIEDALRGLILTSEFGLLQARTEEASGVMGYIASLVSKRRGIWTKAAAFEIIEGDKDLGMIIEQYSKSIAETEKRS